jgi:hypothetical protein
MIIKINTTFGNYRYHRVPTAATRTITHPAYPPRPDRSGASSSVTLRLLARSPPRACVNAGPTPRPPPPVENPEGISSSHPPRPLPAPRASEGGPGNRCSDVEPGVLRPCADECDGTVACDVLRHPDRATGVGRGGLSARLRVRHEPETDTVTLPVGSLIRGRDGGWQGS